MRDRLTLKKATEAKRVLLLISKDTSTFWDFQDFWWTHHIC
ncbi:hypothetical protein ABH908_000366 [Pseudomonas frederiksbergensis]